MFRFPVGAHFFSSRRCPERLLCPASLLFKGERKKYSTDEAVGAWSQPLTQSLAGVKQYSNIPRPHICFPMVIVTAVPVYIRTNCTFRAGLHDVCPPVRESPLLKRGYPQAGFCRPFDVAIIIFTENVVVRSNTAFVGSNPTSGINIQERKFSKNVVTSLEF